MNLRNYILTVAFIIVIFLSITIILNMDYKTKSNTKNELELNFVNFDIYNANSSIRNLTNKSVMISLRENKSKVEIRFLDKESLQDKQISINFYTRSDTNNDWDHSYNCSNLNKVAEIMEDSNHINRLELSENEISFNKRKILNKDFNFDYSNGKETTIMFDINSIDFGNDDLVITLYRPLGYATTIRVDANRFEPIYWDDATMKYNPDLNFIDFIFEEENYSAPNSKIYLKNRYGDFFLYIAIISLAAGIALSMGSLILTFLESKETKNKLKQTEKRLGKIERNSVKEDEIKEINEKLENIDKKINKFLKDRES